MKPEDVKLHVEYHNGSLGSKGAVVTATHTPSGLKYTATERSAHRARDLAVEGLKKLFNAQQVCRSPYCECLKDQCAEGKQDGRDTTMPPNYQKVVDDTVRDLQQTTREAKTRAATRWANEEKTQWLLDKLQEEAAEIIQAVSKIRRFGPQNHHPDRTQTNLQELVGEIEDLQAIVLALEEINYFDPKPSTVSVIKKFNTLISS